MFNKVIIWGYPLYSHTQSYVQNGWYNSFKYLGYDTYWFHDNDYPTDFDYKNSLFMTEGYADNNIPIEKSSTYFVHMCRNPGKYVNNDCRLIDNRFNINVADDWCYSFKLDKSKLIKLSDATFYDPKANDLFLCEELRNNIKNYEAFYMHWATDLLPHEINLEDAYIERDSDKVMYFIGTWTHYNNENIVKLINGLNKHNIKFIHSNPWDSPKSISECKNLIQKSYIAPDVRPSGNFAPIGQKYALCTNHKFTGLIPCRTFKNISYGHLGATNSKAAYELFNGDIVYSENEEELVDLTIEKRKDFEMVKRQMQYVKYNHTYISRIKDLINII